MYFLGQAAALRGWATVRHTFAFGLKRSSAKLAMHLSSRYNVPLADVYLYHTGRTALAAAILAVVPQDAAPGSGVEPGVTQVEVQASAAGDPAPGAGQPEVIVTAMTCYAVVQAVRAAGCVPVFADVEPATLHFNGATLEKSLSIHKNVKAIVVQNNLGHPCKITEIEVVARKYNIPIIEDLAHSAGVRYADGREAGTVGVAAALSFGKGKAIDTTSGGALVLHRMKVSGSANSQTIANITSLRAPAVPKSRPKLADSLRDRWYPFFCVLIRALYHVNVIRNWGRVMTGALVKIRFIKKSADAEVDFSRRLTHWQAKLAVKQFEKLPSSAPVMQKKETLMGALEETYGPKPEAETPLTPTTEGRKPLREYYFVSNRKEVLKLLEKEGFMFDDIWYTTPVAPERYFANSGFNPAECPVATEMAASIVNVPTCYKYDSLYPARKIIGEHPHV